VDEAGLHIKKPFVQQATYFDRRILEWDGRPTQIPTRDKKYIWVDTYARWKIADALKFLVSVRDEVGAHARLDDIVDATVRDLITGHILLEIVRNSNRSLVRTEGEEGGGSSDSAKIELGREEIAHGILESAAQMTPEYGIELLDVRVKRINYVESVRQRVYARMISERERIAERYRSEGKGEQSKILGDMEKELKRISSEAYRKAQEIKGEADAEATEIYASAYEKDPHFYSFVRALESYKRTLDEQTWLILTTESDYFRYLKSSSGR
jgi:membrane protease subunit HflC